MRDSVIVPFRGLTEEREGRVPWLYCDRKGKVTAGLGHLCDSVGDALRIVWKQPDGTRAGARDVADAWDTVKSVQDMAVVRGLGGGHSFWRDLTSLRLTNADIDTLFVQDLTGYDRKLAARFAGYDEWPADAQFGTLSMAYAMGAGFRFPHWESAVLGLDFATAALECKMDDSRDANLAKRNAANRIAFQNAAIVMRDGLDPAQLYWPTDLTLPTAA